MMTYWTGQGNSTITYINPVTSTALRNAVLVPPDLNTYCIAPAIYARRTPAKLVVGSTTPSLRGRTPDADIMHYAVRI
ncbi:hypothetical protein DXD79_06575 [Hungatella hathewayi]|uniref:Uncharacterized protein n=1 Tax=Hungatella hathewayi TaxID=154046 RepID=A0A374PEB7_9FIRM|nr:hypothetical protein DWX31_06135 [Hungatella hathewayi]RGJ06938.1 hypothetical protein DXD79_06575 [Hungatella hathewayi]RGK98136.1 hypothetical protein DXC88_07815 [Hungatella hathewayi]RGM09183.1 hypothetical protein DXC39_04355 [Hungatella hathewayi]RHC46451.1 hypothetical protein DW841_22755 [Hungatella hathewayi]